MLKYKEKQKINIPILNPSTKIISFMEQEKKRFNIVTVLSFWTCISAAMEAKTLL